MSVLCVKKFLSLLSVAILATTNPAGSAGVHATSIRGADQKRRALKSTKSTKNNSGGTPTNPNNFVQPSPTPAPVANPISIEAFDTKCPVYSSTLDACVSNAGGTDVDKETCKICILGIANLHVTNLAGLNSCSKSAVNGGVCKGCFLPAKNYFNCGTGKNLGMETTDEPVTGTPNSVTVVGEEEVIVFVDKPLYAPTEVCPLEEPSSGEDCSTDGYDFMECFYPTSKCTCRKDDPVFLCLDE